MLLDNPKTVVIERDFYGVGEHRFQPRLLALARGVRLSAAPVPAVPSQDQGQGRTLQRLSEVQLPGAAGRDTKAERAEARCHAANAHIGPWLQQVANARVHGTTGEVPNDRLQLERTKLRPSGHRHGRPADRGRAHGKRCPCPIESLQHPLSVYESLLEVA